MGLGLDTVRSTGLNTHECFVALPMPHILYTKINSAKATLINMVGSGGTRAELIPLASVVVNTSFGAYGNKFILNNSGAATVHGTALVAREILLLKQSWHKLYAHCIKLSKSRRFQPDRVQTRQD